MERAPPRLPRGGGLDPTAPSYLDIDVPDQVVAQVVTHVHLLHLAVLLLHLREDLLGGDGAVTARRARVRAPCPPAGGPAHLKELVIVLLHLDIAHGTCRRQRPGG